MGNINVLMACEKRTSREYMLRQLAEECSELSQASLKLIRAWNGETPVTEAEAMARFIEEVADVGVMWEWAYWCFMTDAENRSCEVLQNGKLQRMADRILRGGGGDAENRRG